MATITTSAAQQRSIQANLLTRKQRSLWQDAWWRLRRNKAAMLGLGIIALTAFLAIFAQVIAPYDPTAQENEGEKNGSVLGELDLPQLEVRARERRAGSGHPEPAHLVDPDLAHRRA